MATLIRSSYSVDAAHIDGTPMLVNSPAAATAITSAASALVFGPYTGANFIANPYNFSPTYPLLMKLFFSNIVITGSAYTNPEFIVKIEGPFKTIKSHQFSEKNFGLTSYISNWTSSSAISVTVSIIPVPPLTLVSLNCFAGTATENVQDASAEF
jgi:hypothetical protein